MKRTVKIVLASVVVAFIFCVVGCGSRAEALDEITYNGTNTNLVGDDVSAGPFNLGFTFNYYGTDYTSAYITTNGVVNFATSGYTTYSNTALSSGSAANNSLYSFWDDLITNTNAKTIYYTTVGSAPNRKFIVQWTNMYFCCSTTIPMGTFQTILYEGSNVVQFQYRDLLGGSRSLGDSATVGIKKDNSTYVQTYFGTASLSQGQAITYTPDGSGSYNVNTAAIYDPAYVVPADVPISPTLINPLDGTTGTTVTPTFEWQSVDLATSYRVLVSTVSNFSSTVVNQSGITGTSYTLGSALNYNTNYYWKVEAINGNGSSFSTTRTFTTSAVPNAAPDLPSSVSSADLLSGKRINAATLAAASVGMNLSDPDVGEQLRYRLQIATDSGFNSLVIDYRSSFSDAGSRSFQHGINSGTYLVGSSTTALAEGTSYYIRIRAEDDGAASSSWTVPTGVAFTYDNTAPVALDVPIVSGTPSISSTAISWTASADNNLASPAYRVEYDTDNNFSHPSVRTTNSTNLSLSSLSVGNYYVRVYAIDSAGNESIASPALKFTIDTLPATTSTTTAHSLNTVSSTSSKPATGSNPSSILSSPLTELTTTKVFNVYVVDADGNPISGAKVTLHSIPRVAYTNSEGIATFNEVEAGQHRVIVAYNNLVKETPIELQGAVNDVNVNIKLNAAAVSNAQTITKSNRSLLWQLCAFVCFALSGIFLFLILKPRRSQS